MITMPSSLWTFGSSSLSEPLQLGNVPFLAQELRRWGWLLKLGMVASDVLWASFMLTLTIITPSSPEVEAIVANGLIYYQ
jgi:hypothetical protein